jgi:hypothetical protein
VDRDFAEGLIAGLNRLRAARAHGDKAAVEAAGQRLNEYVGSMEKLFHFLDERRRQVRPSLTVEQIIEWVERESRHPSRWSIATWGMMSQDFEFEALRGWLERTNKAGPWCVAWDPKDPNFMPAGEARALLSGGKPSGPTISKKLGTIPVHYMRGPGRKCRVHAGEYFAWAQIEYSTDKAATEIETAAMKDIEKRLEAERRKKQQRS